jgi:hypothetical protein
MDKMIEGYRLFGDKGLHLRKPTVAAVDSVEHPAPYSLDENAHDRNTAAAGVRCPTYRKLPQL